MIARVVIIVSAAAVVTFFPGYPCRAQNCPPLPATERYREEVPPRKVVGKRPKDCPMRDCMPPELRKTEKKPPAEISSLPKLFAVSVIRLFQVTGSKAEGSRCVFRPTCSAYGKQAVRRFGALRGGVMIFDRIMRCHYCAGLGGYPIYEGRLLDPVWQNDFW